jgi:hypothetical protein
VTSHLSARAVTLVAIVALLGACASPPLASPRLTSKPGDPPVQEPSLDPHLLAARLATAQLLTFTPVPPGAQPSSSPPTPAVARPFDQPATPYLVDQAAWWTAPGTMDSVIAWAQVHPPPGRTTMGGTGSSSVHGVIQLEGIGWVFPPESRVLTDRQLSVMVASDGPDTVALRADAQVIWDPVRASTSLISANAVASVTVTQLPSEPWSPTTNTTLAPTVTVTEPPVVDRYVMVVNSLPVDDNGIMSCPAWTGLRFEVTFHSADGSVVATVTGDEAQCGGFGFTVKDQTQAALSDPDRSLLELVSSTLGLPLST